MGKINRILATVSIILMIAARSVAADTYQWKLAGADEGCKTYTSAVAGKDYIASKCTCVIPAGMDRIGSILRDIESYPEWMNDCAGAKILKVVDDAQDVYIFWFRQHVALYADRDMVLKSKTTCSPDQKQCHIYADSTQDVRVAPEKGFVRMPSFHSLYTLEWIDQNHTRVTCMIDPDLGGGMPAVVANIGIKSQPFKILKKMAEKVKARR